MEYIKLLDAAHYNMIARGDENIWEIYVPKKGWQKTGLLIDYFCDKSDIYDMYEEITKEEALALIA